MSLIGCCCDAVSPGGITLAGCPCTNIPVTLTMKVANENTNSHIFHPCTLQYGPTPPEYAGLGLGANSYVSARNFFDDITADPFAYYFYCKGGLYTLSRVYLFSVFGSPFRDTDRYKWLAGFPGNTCSPFSLTSGTVFTGGDPSVGVSIVAFVPAGPAARVAAPPPVPPRLRYPRGR